MTIEPIIREGLGADDDDDGDDDDDYRLSGPPLQCTLPVYGRRTLRFIDCPLKTQ